MGFSEILAGMDSKIRPLMNILPPAYMVKVYSRGRKTFLKSLVKDIPAETVQIPEEKRQTLWETRFGNGLMNAAGMFKTGEGYLLAVRQGAGAYLAGTTTAIPRSGNVKSGVEHPFLPMPGSGAALNWMGLPNPGHAALAKKLSLIGRKKNCPLGASVSSDPEQSGKEAMQALVEGMKLYDKAGICFIELNESCPNVPHEHGSEFTSDGLDKSLVDRLEYIKENFLDNRPRLLPVIIKFSNDTAAEQIPALLDLMLDMGFDGVNFGNTSINYSGYESRIVQGEKKNFGYFTSEFGGGLSGRPLKDISLELASMTVKYIQSKELNREFNVIRTGGIETARDIAESEQAGIKLNQWFTGYFDSFAKYGHNLYKKIYSDERD
jgi:dihydroorotate dehydrogenase (NAD+) catalytic subunit